ncbi:MAG: hypothetical protein CFE37_01155 [Alphaproteobacteria bacterium PA4]|nr:MAG: hypothetical protein CFE37_01155 [Alphaproteobacteria bacterium PA4]
MSKAFVSGIGASFRFDSSEFRPMSGAAGKVERKATDKKPNKPGKEGVFCPNGGFKSSVGCLPLSAQIATTVILSGLASGIWSIGFWQFFDGRRNACQLSAIGLLACGLVALSGLTWW